MDRSAFFTPANPLESNNQTQLSGCTPFVPGSLCTFDAEAESENVEALGLVQDNIKISDVPVCMSSAGLPA